MFVKNKKRGFSIVELIIVVAIFIVIATVVLTKQSKFSSDILISNMAYEVALTIREAQVYGTGSKKATNSSFTEDENRQVGYGIYINANGTTKPTSMRLFVDRPLGPGLPGNGVYDAGENLSLFNLTRNHRIRNFCGLVGAGPNWSCWTSQSGPFHLNIVFVKPNPDAYMKGGTSIGAGSFTKVALVIESALGDKCRVVTINAGGQIEVEPIYTPVGSEPGCDNPNYIN